MNEPMNIARVEFDSRKEMCDERFKRDNTRLTAIETSLQSLTTLVTQLTEIVKTSITDANDQESRLRTLEMRAGKRYESLWGIVAAAVIGGVIGYFFRMI